MIYRLYFSDGVVPGVATIEGLRLLHEGGFEPSREPNS